MAFGQYSAPQYPALTFRIFAGIAAAVAITALLTLLLLGKGAVAAPAAMLDMSRPVVSQLLLATVFSALIAANLAFFRHLQQVYDDPRRRSRPTNLQAE